MALLLAPMRDAQVSTCRTGRPSVVTRAASGLPLASRPG